MGRIAAHFRSRGENMRPYAARLNALGSSPLTRGKQWYHWYQEGLSGLIPAHAGKTSSRSSRFSVTRAHPRSRGENPVLHLTAVWRVGSSPLTRGKLPTEPGPLYQVGLIPAHAGKTTAHISARPACRAHPRSRGENDREPVLLQWVGGSSPLTRGKRCLP